MVGFHSVGHKWRMATRCTTGDEEGIEDGPSIVESTDSMRQALIYYCWSNPMPGYCYLLKNSLATNKMQSGQCEKKL